MYLAGDGVVDFKERKAKRKKYYLENVFGWKLIKYAACSGTGYYDSAGLPICAACDGTGRTRQKPNKIMGG